MDLLALDIRMAVPLRLTHPRNRDLGNLACAIAVAVVVGSAGAPPAPLLLILPL